MSFSNIVKQELASLHTDKSCCMLSELNALTQSCASLSLSGHGHMAIQFKTENVTVAKRIFILLKKRLEISGSPHFSSQNRFGGRRLYMIRLDPADTRKLMYALHMLHESENGDVFKGIPRRALTRKCCQISFIRGLFLGEGSVSSPEREHHLEFDCETETRAASVYSLLHRSGLTCGTMKRRNRYVVYMKRGDEISSLLGIMGASRAMLEYENLLAQRTLRRTVRHATICDNNNMVRQLSSAQRQIDAINTIKAADRFDELPEDIQQIAELRILHPELSIEEIGQLLSPPLGKSGANHRFRKITRLADTISHAQEVYMQ